MNINKLNRDFYLKTQEYFNRSRQSPWTGWQKLLPHLPRRRAGLPSRRLSVLDLGCGNGRFGKWLAAERTINYVGIDDNQYLLDRAGEILPEAKLIKTDILKPLATRDQFDLVAILGVMHHLSKPDRQPLIRSAAERLKPGGILFLSFWEFLRSGETKVIKNLGNNDYLIDWRLGVTAQRFCHLYTNAEIKSLVSDSRLKLLADFRADASNRYLVLTR